MALVSTIYPPEIWAMESLLVLRDNLVMAALVHRDFENEVANYGDTVRTRKPQKLGVKDFSQQTGTDVNLELLAPENLNAREVTVVLNKHKYTSFIVEDRDASTSIKDLRDEFITPAIDPISQQVDDDVMTEYTTGTDVISASVTGVASGTVGADAAMDEDDIIEARKQLNTNQCPQSGRVMVLGTDHEADILARSLFHQANTAGDTRALRDAVVGRAFGFDTYISQNVPTASDTDSTPQSLAFHRNVLGLVMRPLVDVPTGLGAVTGRAQIDNISVRVTQSYEHRAKGVVLSFDVLYGVSLLDAKLGVIINP